MIVKTRVVYFVSQAGTGILHRLVYVVGYRQIYELFLMPETRKMSQKTVFPSRSRLVFPNLFVSQLSQIFLSLAFGAKKFELYKILNASIC
jgi:hypothetical protein